MVRLSVQTAVAPGLWLSVDLVEKSWLANETAVMRSFDLVIFDCDGVLIDSEKISAEMLIAELATMGVHVDLPYVARHFLGRSYPVVMAQIRRDFAITLPDGFEEGYRNRLLAAFETGLSPTPSVANVLDTLAVPWCVATSSSPRRVEASLRITGLWSVASGRVFTASEVANGKPAPDLFLHAADRMGVSPSACLVIEDSLTGIRAARAAGMAVWRFVGGSHMASAPEAEPDDARPDLSFSDFAGFFDLLPQSMRNHSKAVAASVAANECPGHGPARREPVATGLMPADLQTRP